MRWSAVVLAAGTSSRMGGRHKMLLPVADLSVIRHTVLQVLSAAPHEVVVVIGHKGRDVGAVLADLPVSLQPNLRYEEGQMISVAVGVGALVRPTDAVMVCLGDMVLLRREDYLDLVAAYEAATESSIVIPYHGGERGNPILFSASYAPEVVAGERKLGCRKLANAYPQETFRFEASHDRYTTDMDTPDDYARICARMGHGEKIAV
jgi:molybdenum cofactor cytidylyltransferase